MFSGSDSTESQNYTQWPLNASSFQNMQNEQVDWAALAHQWIKMKEAGPPLPEKVLTAPPPPVISTPSTNKGEAPMDVENDSDSNNIGSDSNEGIQWNAQQATNWNSWSNNSWPPTVTSLPALNKAPLLPTPGYNTFSTNTKDEVFSSTNTQNSGYWTGNGSPNSRSSTAPKTIKLHNKRYNKTNVPLKTPLPPTIGPNLVSNVNDISPSTIDANKRKQLPAWIREGLEKMEKDKLKQMDKYRATEKVNESDEEKKKLREDAMEILKSTVRVSETLVKPLSNYIDKSPINKSDDDKTVPPSAPQITNTIVHVPMTYEEMMLKVRRTMTEVLLKVTNREIAQICKEEQQRHVRKLKAIDQQTAPSAGANLSARLGLGAYDGSGDSSEESGAEEEKTEIDSDNELRETIRRRKMEFEKIEREIESRLAEADADKEIEATKNQRDSPEKEVSPKQSSPDKSQGRSNTPKSSRRAAKCSEIPSSKSRSSSSSSSSPDRRYRRSSRDRRRRSPSSSKKRSARRKYSRSRSRSRSRSNRRYRTERRRDSRSSRRSHSRSKSRCHRSRRRSRSRTRSRSYDGGRGKRSHKH